MHGTGSDFNAYTTFCQKWVPWYVVLTDSVFTSPGQRSWSHCSGKSTRGSPLSP